MLFVDMMYRSFPSVRMTAIRSLVILTEGKDLYALPANHIARETSRLVIAPSARQTMPPRARIAIDEGRYMG